MYRFHLNLQVSHLAFVFVGTFVLVGSMDWLTTVIGIFYFGAVEANPVMANIAMTNLPLFTVIKLATTVAIGLIFYQAEKCLRTTENKQSRSFKLTKATLRITYIGAIAFLLIVVLNNLTVVFNSL